MEWSFSEHESGSRIVVRMAGDCDLYNAPRFKAAVLGKMESGVRRLVFEMSELRYLDSTGVGAIIGILQAAKRLGGELSFVGLGGGPRRVLAMTSILPLMRMGAPGPGEAVTARGTR